MPLSDLWRAPARNPFRESGGEDGNGNSADASAAEDAEQIVQEQGRPAGTVHRLRVKLGMARKHLTSMNKIAEVSSDKAQRICRVAFGSWSSNLNKGNSKT